jgi:excisionase family DNA binding protein
MPVESDSNSLWDANDVARYLKVSRSWVYHRAEAGLLPYLRVGALLRFEPNAIRNFARGMTPAENTR